MPSVQSGQEQSDIRWGRGHSGDAGTTIADELADLGTRLDEKHSWWKRAQPMGDWDESTFQAKLNKLEEEKTQNVKALGVQWDGDVDFRRGDLPSFKDNDKSGLTVGNEMVFCNTHKLLRRGPSEG